MSGSWQGLFLKEWKMMKGVVITAFILAMLLFIFLDGFTAAELMNFSLFITPLYVLYSLNTESNQIHDFLHLPNRANKLFLVKILTGLSFTVIYQLVLVVIILLTQAFQKIGITVGIGNMMLYLMYCVLSMLVISLLPTAMLLLAWNVYHWLKGMIGPAAFVITIAVTLLGFVVIINLWDTAWYMKLTNWGEISFSLDNFKGLLEELRLYVSFHLGVVLFHAVLAVASYGLSCWLLDRKVGV